MQQDNRDHPSEKKLHFNNLFPYILAATAILILSIITGLLTPLRLADSTIEELKQILQPLGTLNTPTLFFIIFLNNAVKALGAILLGILLGLPSIFFIGANGFILGLVVSALKTNVGYGLIVGSLAPHGIIEIPLLVLSTSLGLSIGMESLKYLMKQNSIVKTQIGLSIKLYTKWILTGLIFAALIEVFLTPLIVSLLGGT